MSIDEAVAEFEKAKGMIFSIEFPETLASGISAAFAIQKGLKKAKKPLMPLYIVPYTEEEARKKMSYLTRRDITGLIIHNLVHEGFFLMDTGDIVLKYRNTSKTEQKPATPENLVNAYTYFGIPLSPENAVRRATQTLNEHYNSIIKEIHPPN